MKITSFCRGRGDSMPTNSKRGCGGYILPIPRDLCPWLKMYLGTLSFRRSETKRTVTMADMRHWNAIFNSPNQSRAGLELAEGSKIVLKNPETGLKVKIEMPKEGLFKRLTRSSTRRSTTRAEGQEAQHRPPPVPPRGRQTNEKLREDEYQDLIFDKGSGGRVESNHARRLGPIETPGTPTEDIGLYDSPTYQRGPVSAEKAKFPEFRNMPLCEDRALNLQCAGPNHLVHRADETYMPPVSPQNDSELNTDIDDEVYEVPEEADCDSQLENSFGENMEKAYRQLRQDYINMRVEAGCPRDKQTGAPVNNDISPVPTPDYWIS
ncbi:uncharacterized protein LOC110984983 [Acanthaster planci]|uniref:Uncharacterized protein LOC110984983 n=1 Tax=Acanthaster planci TaxID=133434 RepID=A0A8B7Z6S8_ACAPL|nr:uncharacterized protein LOC110984983 [Acanthaster planci]